MPNYYDHFGAANELTANGLNTEMDKLDAEINTLNAGNFTSLSPTTLGLTAGTELTIASGAVTVTQSVHTIDTQADASTDDLTDLNGGDEGDLLIISAANAARTVVVKHNTSKIALADGADVELDETWKRIILYCVSTGVWAEIKSPSPAGSSSPSYVKVTETQSKGTNGGTNTAGWQVRTLNTEDADPDGICSLSSNQITLDAGTYECRISAPACAVDQHHAVLWNATDSSLVLNGTTEHIVSTSVLTTRSFVMGRFTIGASKALEVRHFTTTALATFGLGVATNQNDPGGSSMSEVYTIAEFWKVA